ncbi:NAD-dependent epimerase/dehydratase family protein [Arenivirga flava]|uniref:dTDP-4-dehydrorhamnose 3,5-epimerase n=1 Tax=Arenivirga flava TaxID=1930060 RepID=A0AA37UES8_9MICO|nr:NAD-dependent epimerase/dehydratase family protein [Arenivirga flava]GMA27788.1 dTDP-4-dehydrorhamnose 3,5-epimerase [Arenivirga flava]
MGEHALVTGASGFLGRHVVRELLAHGYEVTAAGRDERMLPTDAPRLVGDLHALPGSGLRPDVIVHCAALSTPWGRWRDFERTNVQGTGHVLELARRSGARRIVHISSPSVHAEARDRIGIREHDPQPARAMNGYIRSKRAAEALLLGERARPEVVVLRPRGLIGRGERTLVPRLLAVHERIGIPLFRGGGNLVDLTAVENVASAARLALQAPGADGEVLNVTNGDPRPFKHLLDQLLDGMGIAPRYRHLPIRPVLAAAGALEAVAARLPGRPEPPLTRYTVASIAFSQTLDIGAARRVLGYEPLVSLDEGLASYA